MEQDINGMKKNKLLQQTIYYYFLYSIVILVIIGPIFYFLSVFLYEKEANEDLYVIKEQFDKTIGSELKVQDIAKWNKFNRNVSILFLITIIKTVCLIIYIMMQSIRNTSLLGCLMLL